MIYSVWERRETPPEVVSRVTQAGGTNAFGEPNFRVIWGANAHDHIGLLYPTQANAWHLERWLSPEVFGAPSQWDKTDGGAYPDRGAYMHVMCFGPKVTPTAAEYVIRALMYGLEHYTPGERMAALRRREEQIAQAWNCFANEILELEDVKNEQHSHRA